MIRSSFAAAVILTLGGFSSAQASSVEKLKEFIQHTATGKAQFSQELLDKNGRSVQKSKGTMEFSRPGKFRWSYEKPYEQLIVGDGEKLWVFDPELNQVTVKKLDQALGESPAALLAGSNAIEKNFRLTDDGAQAGLEWLKASPKTQEGSFESVRMGFNQSGLQVMELRDHFGQTTVLHFLGLERNPRLNPELFKFTPPKGADIVGE